MGVGALIKLLDALAVFHASNDFQVSVGKWKESFVRLGMTKDAKTIAAGGITTISAPAATPAYIGVGYIIGPELGALNFAGGLLSWGLFVPLLVFFLGPSLIDSYLAGAAGDQAQAWGLLTRRTSTATSSGRSPSAGCSSAPASRSGGCGRTS